MVLNGQTVKRITSAIERDFVPTGASKHGHSYTWPVTEGFSGWLGINMILGRADDAVGLNPIVGVVSEQIEDLLRSTSGWPQPAPTLISSLGYLLPAKRYVEWPFAAPWTSASDAKTNELIACLKQYGIPFIKSNASLPAIIENLEETRHTYKQSAIYRLPAAYLIQGDSARARRYVEDQLTAMKGANDMAATDYRAFAAKFLDCC